MKISRMSALTGKLNTMDLDVTREQADALLTAKHPLLVCQTLQPCEGAFLTTGVLPAEEKLFATGFSLDKFNEIFAEMGA